MAQLPGLRDVTSDLLNSNPQVNVNIDRDKASALGVTAEQVEDALYTAYGQRQVSTIYAPNDEYWVVMELQDKYQADPAALSLLYIRSKSGALGTVELRRKTRHQPRAAHRESPGAASVRHGFVQSQSGILRLATRWLRLKSSPAILYRPR